MNKVILIGRLTKDPELRYAAGSGTAVCRFTVAINRQFKKYIHWATHGIFLMSSLATNAVGVGTNA